MVLKRKAVPRQAKTRGRIALRWMLAALMLMAALPAMAAPRVPQPPPQAPQARKQQARTQFETAERMREELNGLPQRERTRREYQRVTDAYRRVYYTAPASSKADASVVAVAELLAEVGRTFHDERSLRAAIAQYEFLRREYPGSKYRFDALFTIGQIYKEDLEEHDKARETFQEVIHRYPHLQLAADAREAVAELDQQARNPHRPKPVAVKQAEPRTQESKAPEAKPETRNDLRTQDAKIQDARGVETSAETAHATLPLVTGIRHWSTPDYTRVAIDLEQEVKYEAGRVSNPDRIFFDLHDTKLASTLVGKTFEVSDGFLRRVRIAQFQKGMVRVVLEVDDVSDYAAFLLPNPYRLIVDIHGRKSNAPQTLVARAQQAEESKASAASMEPAAASQKPTAAAQKAAVPSQKNAAESKPGPSSSVAREMFPAPLAAPPAPTDAAPGDTVQRAQPVVSSPQPAAVRPAPTPVVSAVTHDDQPTVRAGAHGSSPEIAPAPKLAAPVADQPPAHEAERPSARGAQESTKSEVGRLNSVEQKATAEPTSEPTVQVVAPREPERKTVASARPRSTAHQASPTADGQRSLIRALGLKVGRIVIDAGHGGHDTGTIGPNGLLEKDLVLDVSLRLGRLLQTKMGAEVIYTRDDDTFIPLETRTAIANKQQADLFVSVHANSSQDASARGVETYYLNFNPSPDALEVAARENAVSEKSVHELGDLVKKIALKEKVEESREFATDVQRSLYQGLAGKERTMKDRGVKKAPFIVLIGANMPSILAEISFVSNPADERKLQTPEYRQKIAEALYRGIARYINGLSGVKVAAKNATAGEGRN